MVNLLKVEGESGEAGELENWRTGELESWRAGEWERERKDERGLP
jgi:hypothetical protein